MPIVIKPIKNLKGRNDTTKRKPRKKRKGTVTAKYGKAMRKK